MKPSNLPGKFIGSSVAGEAGKPTKLAVAEVLEGARDNDMVTGKTKTKIRDNSHTDSKSTPRAVINSKLFASRRAEKSATLG